MHLRPVRSRSAATVANAREKTRLLDTNSWVRLVQLFRDLRTDLRGVAVDCLTARKNDVLGLDAVGVDRRRNDLARRVRVGTAELARGDENTLVHAHCHELAEHALCGRRSHRERNDLAAQFILERERRFDRIHVVGVDDGLHGRAVQRAD